MARDGKAKVLSTDEFDHLITEIEEHRYPEKNSLIMQISFKLGLRVQEISLLRIREVAKLGPEYKTLPISSMFFRGERSVTFCFRRGFGSAINTTLFSFVCCNAAWANEI